MIKIHDLRFRYDKTDVLKGVTTEIEAGVLCGLFGPNGSGKTTLFKCCLNFLRVTKGEIWIDGLNTRFTPVNQLAKAVAFVPQDHKPPFPYKVKEVVLMGRTPHMGGGIFDISDFHKQKSIEAMQTLDILDLAELPYNQLSGGQRQLVLIARAIAQETPVLFLDEPTSALDFHNQIKIWQILRQLAQQGLTVVACSHDPNHVAWFCDRVVMMSAGQIIADDRPEACFTEDTLSMIYQDTCAVRHMNGVKVVLPRIVANGNGSSDLE